MIYKVTKKFLQGQEVQSGTFKTYPEAKKYIQEKLEDDAIHKVNAVYKIYEGIDLLEELNQSNRVPPLSSSEDSSDEASSGGRGHYSRPSPLNTSPQPKGIPRTWNRGEPDEDEGKK